jgi:hypothetical protein
MSKDTIVHKKIESVKVAANRPYEPMDYAEFFIGFIGVGVVDVLKNFRHVWPCVGDVSNILEGGFDTYKYMHLYEKTNNSFLMVNAFGSGMSAF